MLWPEKLLRANLLSRWQDLTGANSDKSRAGTENGEERAHRDPWSKIAKNFTVSLPGFTLGHRKKSFRKLNKVKFQGFLGVCDFTFLYRPDEAHD
jgi:hypothetical protein